MNVAVAFSIALMSATLGQETSNFAESHSFNLLDDGKIIVSGSATQVGVIGRFRTEVFSLSEDRWHGPLAIDRGYFGAENNVRRVANDPVWGWVTEPDGSEIFIVDFSDRFAVVVRNQKVEAIVATGSLIYKRTDVTGRLIRPLIGHQEEYLAAKRAMYLELKGSDSNQPGFATNRRNAELPETLFGIADFSPQHDRVLCRPTEDDPLLSLNLLTGEQIPFYIQNNRDRALPGDMSGSFSPDGEYVLMQYSYGPDDQYAGGYLQLFTKDGKFVEEVAEFHKDVAMPVGFHEWLHNNWIVYSTGKEIVFKKFVGPAAESER